MVASLYLVSKLFPVFLATLRRGDEPDNHAYGVEERDWARIEPKMQQYRRRGVPEPVSCGWGNRFSGMLRPLGLRLGVTGRVTWSRTSLRILTSLVVVVYTCNPFAFLG
jgi:hypothetical protein